MNNIVSFITAPNPDNFLQVLACKKLFPEDKIEVVVTGRAVVFDPDKPHTTWKWMYQNAILAQKSHAQLLKKFTRQYGFTA